MMTGTPLPTILNLGRICERIVCLTIRKRLFKGTIAVNKKHLTGTVPLNKKHLTGPFKEYIFTQLPLPNSLKAPLSAAPKLPEFCPEVEWNPEP